MTGLFSLLMIMSVFQQVDARQPTRFPELGLRLLEPTPELLERYGLPLDSKGLIVRGVDPDSRADQGGLEIGMLITDAAGRKVTNLSEFRSAMSSHPAKNDMILRILKKSKAEFRVIIH